MNPRVAGVIFLMIIGPVGLLATFWTVVCISRNEYLTVLVTIGMATFCFGMSTAGVVKLAGRVVARTTYDRKGTTIRPDPLADRSMLSGCSGLVVASFVFAIFQPLGKIDIPIPQTQRLALPFMAAATVLIGVPMLWPMFRRGSTGYLRLTPVGYEIASGFKPSFGDWSGIVKISDAVPLQKKQQPENLVVERSDGSWATLSAGSITPGGADLRSLMQFYWKHPECRDELTDGRTAQRLAERRFKNV
jgi:hypothetical protein